MNELSSENVRGVLGDLFRRESGRITATLTRILGTDQLDIAENISQDSLILAMKIWPIKGIPDNPGAWLIQCAKNSALDYLRKKQTITTKQSQLLNDDSLEPVVNSKQVEVYFESELSDDQLRMLFTCCHPCMNLNTQIALTLKTLCGLGVDEIARAFLVPTATIEQRLVRAKKKIKFEKIRFDIPDSNEIAHRFDAVLGVLYALFTEGYSASEGDRLIKSALCFEAIRLANILTEHPIGSKNPKLFALMALMLLQSARFDARLSIEGDIILLEDQDRSLWNKATIQQGFRCLAAASKGTELSRFHLEAAIAACHTGAATFEKTDWPRIHQYYCDLMAICPSPIVALNRTIALAMKSGFSAGIKELEKIGVDERLKNYHLYQATLADFYRRVGKNSKAFKSYKAAIALTTNPVEISFLEGRLELVTVESV